MYLPPLPIIEFFPEYRSTQIAWQGLTPIAAWAIADIKPRRVVELGSYRGDSFFAFLQAAKNNTKLEDIVAVDSWGGDQHTGAFVEAVYEQFHAELAARNDKRARSIRDYFVNAVSQFEDQSIDLLHIDGAHDYKSVREDYKTWLPKMSSDGVIFFHDTMVHKEDFGVWKFWAELEEMYPQRCFNFTHSNGLGVLCLGTSEEGDIRQLCKLSPENARLLRDIMTIAGERVTKSTTFEAKLITRNGGEIENEHIFARGEHQSVFESLRLVEAQFGMDQVAAHADLRVEKLVNEQTGDVFNALKPRLTEHTQYHANVIASERFEALRKEHIGIVANIRKLVRRKDKQ